MVTHWLLRTLHPDLGLLLGGILRTDPKGVAVLVPRLAPDDYFHLIAGAHVVLDPLHFGGANTVYDALTAGAVELGTDAGRRARVFARIRDGAPFLFERRAAVEQLEGFLEDAVGQAEGK